MTSCVGDDEFVQGYMGCIVFVLCSYWYTSVLVLLLGQVRCQHYIFRLCSYWCTSVLVLVVPGRAAYRHKRTC